MIDKTADKAYLIKPKLTLLLLCFMVYMETFACHLLHYFLKGIQQNVIDSRMDVLKSKQSRLIGGAQLAQRRLG